MELVSELVAPTLQLTRTTSRGGRGPAVNAGVRLATGDVILVLHADTALPPKWDADVLSALADPRVLMTAFSFACDRAQLRDPHAPPTGLALMEWTVNCRSGWYELPFGDQALATTRQTLEAAGGYPAVCILEEFLLVNRLRLMSAQGLGRIVTLPQPALCSPRRWERHTVWRVNAVNQAVMLWHRCGATPTQVFEFYYGVPAPVASAPTEWAPLSRCVNGERTPAWAKLFGERRVVLIHIPRCAGTSLEAALYGKHEFSQHHTAEELKRHLGTSAYDAAFKLAFLRDPVHRFLSAFYYLLFRGLTQRSAETISPHDLLAGEMLHRDFHAEPLKYLRHLASLDGKGWEGAPLHFRPQADFLGPAGVGGLTFVGRFEQLDHEYGRLLQSSGRVRSHASPRLGHHRQAIPAAAGLLDIDTARREQQARIKWAEDEELRALMRKVYAADYLLVEERE